jgi:predicted phage terminase large subunit-like protein
MLNYNQDQRIAIAEAARQELARRYYADYIDYVHGGAYRHAKHTRYICKVLEGVLLEGGKRIILELPPRHSKSMTVTETFPSFYLGKNPDKRVILASYGDDLALDFSRKNRQKLSFYGDALFRLNIAKDKSSVGAWDIAGHRGGLVAAGIGSAITGKGADLLIIDDPVKNDSEAQSPVYRNRVYNEYKSTLLTRLHAGGSIILIMTRWHEDDLAGRLLREEPDKWTLIRLPAECDGEDDIIGRKTGDPLWPEGGYGKAWIQDTKTSLGSRVWTSLYQQLPSIESGNVFKRDWIKYYDTLPDGIEQWMQSWDFTFKDNDGTDYVCGGVWAKKGSMHYLVYRIKERMDFVKSQQRMLDVTKAYPQAVGKLVEEKANGAAIISSLRTKVAGIIPVNPTESKEARAYAITPLFEAGNVAVPKNAIWIEDYINELLSFPNGAHDDQVDMTTQYLRRFIGRGTATVGAWN